MERDAYNKGEIEEQDMVFNDLEKFTASGTVFDNEDEVAKSLSKLVN